MRGSSGPTLSAWYHSNQQEIRFLTFLLNIQAAKNPGQAYVYTSQLLGKIFGNPAVTETAHHFPYAANLIEDGERGTFAIQFDDSTTLSPEEVVGMILNYARTVAEAFTKGKVRDCVITVRD